uniref:RNA-editing substrate-binding complex 6 protein domain-containing protein n=1 Tax=Chromera velia CCMP2878 TaxID=1169474 RepID=A0A0G4IFM4_9ALVE|eukprot:Cvel_14062.t1-p1 / transcript=Cvel_14062.t1 / gene=Cvel_14062 / organism=Chromera_velia_CCMP2878 / gene_product=hypothetical protein / transcript_product=hypothetical protein / location=Cvel_scaffold986:40188-51199(+) / protein_length=1534 / sequence_SO=supercontig / SO=protein_coding / is_pseudo=false
MLSRRPSLALLAQSQLVPRRHAKNLGGPQSGVRYQHSRGAAAAAAKAPSPKYDFERSFDEETPGVNDFGEPSFNPNVYTSVLRDETNSSLRKLPYGDRPSTLFKRRQGDLTDDPHVLKEQSRLAKKKEKIAERYRTAGLETQRPMNQQKTFWEELQETEKEREAQIKASKARSEEKKKERRAELRARRVAPIGVEQPSSSKRRPQDASVQQDPESMILEPPFFRELEAENETGEGTIVSPDDPRPADFSRRRQRREETAGDPQRPHSHSRAVGAAEETADPDVLSLEEARPRSAHADVSPSPSPAPGPSAIAARDRRETAVSSSLPEGFECVEVKGDIRTPGEDLRNDVRGSRAITHGSPFTPDTSTKTVQSEEIEISPSMMTADPTSSPGGPPEAWLNASPAEVLVHQELLKARDSSSVLVAVGTNLLQLNHLSVATAMHRLGRTAGAVNRLQVIQDNRFRDLLSRTDRLLPEMSVVGLSNVLWALVKLQFSPVWLPRLISELHEKIKSPDCRSHHLSTVLYALSRMPFASKEAEALRDETVGAVKARVLEFSEALDLTCVVGALAKLEVRDPELFSLLARQATSLGNELDMGELASISWAFARLAFTDRKLFEFTRKALVRRASECSPKDVVQLAWSMARLKEADEEVFKYTITPLVRASIGEFEVRDLSTVAWAYSHAGIRDSDLFGDIGAALLPRVREFTPHDIATVSLAFADSRTPHKGILSALKRRAIELAHTFSPLQLAKSVYGFGVSGITDAKLFHALCDQILERRAAVRPENAVQILAGLQEIEYLEHPVVPVLLEMCRERLHSIFAEDCVQLLWVLSKIDEMKRPRDLAELLISQIIQRLRTWRCFEASNVADLFEALHDLRIDDQNIVQEVCQKLAPIIRAAPKTDFLRVLGAIACMNGDDRLLVRVHLHRRPKLQMALMEKLRQLAGLHSDLQSLSVLAYACARVGFEDEATSRIHDAIRDKMTSGSEKPSVATLCYLLWTFTELNVTQDWTKSLLRSFLEERYSRSKEEGEGTGRQRHRGEVLHDGEGIVEVDAEDDTLARRLLPGDTEGGNLLMRVAWACVVHGEWRHLVDLIEEAVGAFDGTLPRELLMAQQVGLQLRLEAEIQKQYAVPTDGRDGGGKGSTEQTGPTFSDLSADAREWMTVVLECPRQDVYVWKGGAKFRHMKKGGVRVRDYNFDKWLSECLLTMRIPHKSSDVVANIYRISVSFPLEGQCIDVLNFDDILAPSCRPLASAELRQRQLALLGWGVHSVHLRDLYNSMEDHTIRVFVAKIVSNFLPDAARFASPFKKDPGYFSTPRKERPQSDPEGADAPLSASPSRGGAAGSSSCVTTDAGAVSDMGTLSGEPHSPSFHQEGVRGEPEGERGNVESVPPSLVLSDRERRLEEVRRLVDLKRQRDEEDIALETERQRFREEMKLEPSGGFEGSEESEGSGSSEALGRGAGSDVTLEGGGQEDLLFDDLPETRQQSWEGNTESSTAGSRLEEGQGEGGSQRSSRGFNKGGSEDVHTISTSAQTQQYQNPS